jgi:hypothetical protein
MGKPGRKPNPPQKRDLSFKPAALDIPMLAHFLGVTLNRADELTRDTAEHGAEIPYRFEGKRKVVDTNDAEAWNARQTERMKMQREAEFIQNTPILQNKMLENVEKDQDGNIIGVNDEEE